ncbi:MAG TPA: histidine phosphatase family protein [Trebonia sp.]|nr:histidine phosphatase family protein [Trebonia sp.]
MNHLAAAGRLRNRYSVMRHGQSKANARGIIVSRIETDASGDYGLTGLGREQARAAARACPLPAGTLVCSSDFARAWQTAQIVAACLGSPPVAPAAALRERSFGSWEGTAVANYDQVWADDAAGRAGEGVEPAPDVLARATAYVLDLEREHAGRDILLVSHGDTAQILLAGFLRRPPATHRSLPPLATAEIRPLVLAPR